MNVVAHHLLLAFSAAALLLAGLRAASLAAPRGLERVVAAAVLAAAAAGCQALALGLFGLGASPVALGAAAGLTWAAAWRWLPRPATGVSQELGEWWSERSLAGRAVAGAVAGAGVAWTAWVVRYPAIGVDGLYYHLPEIVNWVQNGRPGSVVSVFAQLPVGNYPVTNELLLAWGVGIAQSFVPVSIWVPAMLALLAGAAWMGLREAKVPAVPRAAATAAICVSPTLTAWQDNGPATDLPALAWLVSAAALSAVSARRPGLVAPAVIAAGLAVGTKTTTLPLAALVVGVALYVHRRRIATNRWLSAGTAAGALLIGSVWYVRNLLDHGSPFWPFVSAPWGDPVPAYLDAIDVTFLERAGDTLDRFSGEYLDLLAGGLLLLGAGALVGLVRRERAVVAASAATALSVLLWMRAPFTGVTDLRDFDGTTVSTVRYLLPATAAGACALALSTRRSNGVAAVATAILVVAAVWSAERTLALGFAKAPTLWTFVAGAAIGAAAGAILRAPRAEPPSRPWLARPAAAALITAVVGVALAVGAPGYLERHGETPAFDVEFVRWIAAHPEFDNGDRPVAMAPRTIGLLSGDRLQHELELIPADEPCPLVERRRERGWVVVVKDGATATSPDSPMRCLRGQRPAYDDPHFSAYEPRS